MAHLAVRSGYQHLVERLNRFPQGAPPDALLFQILALLFTEREAELVALLPIRPFRVERAAQAWKVTPAEAQRTLDTLADKGILLDFEQDGRPLYLLPPPMAGFFEFSMMRVRGDLDQKLLAELLYQYIDVEEAFVRELFVGGETRLGRVFVQEAALPPRLTLQVFDYERASWVVRSASDLAVGLCYCRHKMQHLGRACDAPLPICMTFGAAAASLIKHGLARRADAAEGIELLRQAQERSLVQFGDNARERVSFLCNCCGCCCEALLAARRFGLLHAVATSNWISELDVSDCNGCGRCVEACPVDAVALVPKRDPRHPKWKVARRDAAACLGCGVCVRSCRRGCIRMQARAARVFTPVDSVHRAVLMAIERGKLQELIFDNQAHLSHRAMAAVLGAILRLPPVKRALASRQMKSRYLEALLSRRGRE